MESGAFVQNSHDEAEMEEMEKVPWVGDSSCEDHLTSSSENAASGLSKLFRVDSGMQV